MAPLLATPLHEVALCLVSSNQLVLATKTKSKISPKCPYTNKNFPNWNSPFNFIITSYI